MMEITMRVINLDETGIKLISNKRQQIYLSVQEIQSFLDGNYKIDNYTLIVGNKRLALSDIDVHEFQSVLNYIAANFKK